MFLSSRPFSFFSATLIYSVKAKVVNSTCCAVRPSTEYSAAARYIFGKMQHLENLKFQWHIRNELYPRIYPLPFSFAFFFVAVVVSSFKKQSKNLLTQWWPPILPALHFPKTLAPLPWCLSACRSGRCMDAVRGEH